MSNIRNIETNPAKAIPIDKEQTINRLEKIRKICDTVSLISSVPSVGAGITLPFMMMGWNPSMPNTPMTSHPFVLGTAAVFAVSSACWFATSLISKKLGSKIKNLQKQVNPKAYIEKILEIAQKKLKISEEATRGLVSIKTLQDDGIDLDSISFRKKYTKEAIQLLPVRKQKVAILEAAHGFIEKCNDENSISKIIDLVDNPIENKDAIQKIISPQQTSAKISMNEAKFAVQMNRGKVINAS